MAVNIKDRIAVGDDLYRLEQLDDGRVRITPAPDSVQEAGTPINKALLQPAVDAAENAPFASISSGGWRYREWADGQIIFYGSFSIDAGVEFSRQASTGFYISKEAISFDLPKTCVSSVSCVATMGTIGIFATQATLSNSAVSINLASVKNITTSNAIYIRIVAWGKTK